MNPLRAMAGWPVPRAAGAVVHRDTGVVERFGPTEEPFALASVTKPLFALASLVAVEDGSLDLQAPAGPPGATVEHLLAHASGLGPDSDEVLAPPGRRRIYSNAGFDALGVALRDASGLAPHEWWAEGLAQPLGLRTATLAPEASPASAGWASVEDLCRVALLLLGHPEVPALLAPATMAGATAVIFPGIRGVVPGWGSFDPCDWGLGFELKTTKQPHWTPPSASPATFGHFGSSGTFFWVDPVAGIALVCLTDRPFGEWATTAWPDLGTSVLAAWGKATATE